MKKISLIMLCIMYMQCMCLFSQENDDEKTNESVVKLKEIKSIYFINESIEPEELVNDTITLAQARKEVGTPVCQKHFLMTS